MPRSALAVLGPDGRPLFAYPGYPVLRGDDLGVLRGQAVFETVRVAGGRAFRLADHLVRLHASAARMRFAVPAGVEELVEHVLTGWAADGATDDAPTGPTPAEPPGAPETTEMTETTEAPEPWTGDGALRVVVTKGPPHGRPQAYALLSEVPPETVAARARGVRAITVPLGVPAGLRQEAPWLLGGVKSTSYAVNMAVLAHAHDEGVDDAVLVSSDGEVLEAPTSTVAWVREGLLVTPPAAEVGILEGTTLAVVLELAAQLAVPAEVRRGTVEELVAADEVLMLSSVRGVAAVVELDGRALPAGPVTLRLQAAFEDLVNGVAIPT